MRSSCWLASGLALLLAGASWAARPAPPEPAPRAAAGAPVTLVLIGPDGKETPVLSPFLAASGPLNLPAGTYQLRITAGGTGVREANTVYLTLPEATGMEWRAHAPTTRPGPASLAPTAAATAGRRGLGTTPAAGPAATLVEPQAATPATDAAESEPQAEDAPATGTTEPALPAPTAARAAATAPQPATTSHADGLGTGAVVQGHGAAATGPLLVLDLAPAAGDQGLRQAEAGADGRIEVQVTGSELPAIYGWSATVEFDATQIGLAADGFRASNWIPGLVPLVGSEPGRAEVGGANFTQALSSGTGDLGSVAFQLVPGFAGKTEIRLTQAKLRQVGRTQPLNLDQRVTVALAGATAVPQPPVLPSASAAMSTTTVPPTAAPPSASVATPATTVPTTAAPPSPSVAMPATTVPPTATPPSAPVAMPATTVPPTATPSSPSVAMPAATGTAAARKGNHASPPVTSSRPTSTQALAELVAAVRKKKACEGCDLTGAALPQVAWRGVQLRQARLAKADLTAADLTGTKLSGADLSHANLTRADLSRADLTGADLSGARLKDANLTRARLNRANLTGAVITGARLTGADLTNATWIDGRCCGSGSISRCR